MCIVLVLTWEVGLRDLSLELWKCFITTFGTLAMLLFLIELAFRKLLQNPRQHALLILLDRFP